MKSGERAENCREENQLSGRVTDERLIRAWRAGMAAASAERRNVPITLPRLKCLEREETP